MALAITTIIEVQTGGSDTLNGGAFDPGQTAGMFTDGAATSADGAAPVFTSASYNFVAGDVGAWVFIGAGTNWTKGWYNIASVAANAATLSAAIGAAVSSSGATTSPIAPSTVVGCATTASPTGATWSIDYSQQAAAEFTYTDLASVGAGLTVSSVAFPFAKQQVGNCLVITGGTNFTTGRYVIASVAAGVATVVGPANITTGAGVSGTGGLGGAVASLGQAGAFHVAGNGIYQKTGSYTITSASSNVASGCFTANAGANLEGYDTVRGDLSPLGAAGTRPTNTASGISTFTLITHSSATTDLRNLILDGASLTSSRGIFVNVGQGLIYNVKGQNMTNSAFVGASTCVRCVATGCSTVSAFNTTTTHHIACVSYSNTVTGFTTVGTDNAFNHCLSYNNSGASSDGFTAATTLNSFVNCVSYGNGRDGFRISSHGNILMNCIAESNTGLPFTITGTSVMLINCAYYNNTGGAPSVTGVSDLVIGFIVGTASFFVNAAGANFALNETAGGGTSARGTGYPGVLPIGGTGYPDIGALQHADPVSVGSVGKVVMVGRGAPY